MRVVIIEDEWGAQEQLKIMLAEIVPNIEIVNVIDTVKNSIAFFQTNPTIDLVFMDIHLADGLSFEIFNEIHLNLPIIFITAYDQYAIKAFKVNGIDYILKPLIKGELERALEKYQNQTDKLITQDLFESFYHDMVETKREYKNSFLLGHKDRLYPVSSNDIASFYVDLGVVKCYTFEHNRYVINNTLDNLENELDPNLFFRANRQFILHRKSIEHVNYYFNSKLKIKTCCDFDMDIVISKLKATDIKKWLGY
ncbi:LytR/AlgR family response regulator transcription factor [Labilibacter marinus]|uniref:LytR/AlgR family response regulator transcription factor n=1 Tax=Labilibacter marinus TaxID=1477105 RepID=UPI0008339866|nr:LytTR family DNA-binding domain-containing protein [Labilibacter marinus]